MNKNNKEYDRQYQKLKYEMETGKREDMLENVTTIDFIGDIKPNQLKKAYKGKIETDEQKLLLNNALVIVDLIQSCKKSLETDGVYTKTLTGLVKENPAQKSLRENVKTLTVLIEALNKSILTNKKEDELDLEKWLDSDY